MFSLVTRGYRVGVADDVVGLHLFALVGHDPGDPLASHGYLLHAVAEVDSPAVLFYRRDERVRERLRGAFDMVRPVIDIGGVAQGEELPRELRGRQAVVAPDIGLESGVSDLAVEDLGGGKAERADQVRALEGEGQQVGGPLRLREDLHALVHPAHELEQVRYAFSLARELRGVSFLGCFPAVRDGESEVGEDRSVELVYGEELDALRHAAGFQHPVAAAPVVRRPDARELVQRGLELVRPADEAAGVPAGMGIRLEDVDLQARLGEVGRR
jgi:hypothetical protein